MPRATSRRRNQSAGKHVGKRRQNSSHRCLFGKVVTIKKYFRLEQIFPVGTNIFSISSIFAGDGATLYYQITNDLINMYSTLLSASV